MGISRYGTDGSLPRSDYAVLTANMDVNNTAKKFTASKLLVQRIIIEVPSTNTAAITIGPDTNATWKSFASGAAANYVIEAAPGTSFDLSGWYLKSATAAGNTLGVAYQPA